ncbi:hypothetical protein ACLM44_11690 [Synechococcus sp. W2B2]|uniref:hypothetical protein n=1 Tax=unclassified Synechococcus TaxID=2626047 RepID=UPI0003167C7E|nr:hypothetical protein [Synechococcus sp. WH 7805]
MSCTDRTVAFNQNSGSGTLTGNNDRDTGFRTLGSEQLTSSMHRSVMDASGAREQ